MEALPLVLFVRLPLSWPTDPATRREPSESSLCRGRRCSRGRSRPTKRSVNDEVGVVEACRGLRGTLVLLVLWLLRC